MMTKRRGVSVIAAMAVTVALGACGDDDTSGSTPSASESTTKSPPPAADTTTTTPPSGNFDDVEFAGRDGDVRQGRLFGSGQVAIVLSHMGNPDNSQDDWAQMATAFADAGYLVLTYDRRLQMSDGWLDVVGAVEYLRDQGAEKVVAAGASIGAMASMRAAEEPDSNISGVVWLAGVLSNSRYFFEKKDVAEVACPVLIISAEDDRYGAGDDARQLHDWLPQTSELMILDSFRHGTNIFEDDGENPDVLRQALLDFVDDVAASPHSPC